jgi:hypothetical protein
MTTQKKAPAKASKQNPKLGHNVTGLETSGDRAEEMQEAVSEFPPTSSGTSHGPGKVRVAYAREGAELGSVPPPSSVRGVAKAAKTKLTTGASPVLLMDKLGERLAFERTGTRLYEGLIAKHEASGGFEGGPTRQELVKHLNEEHAHFIMLSDTMEAMGADPTAMTPSADLAATASEGVLKVIADPRTTLLQSLEAMMIAELTDQNCWDTLMQMASEAGDEELAGACAKAYETEIAHLDRVQLWVRAGQGRGLRAAE